MYVVVLCNVSQTEVDPSECPKMRSFASNELRTNCDTNVKLPFRTCEFLALLNKVYFYDTFIVRSNYELNLLLLKNSSKAWDVTCAPQWNHPSRPQPAVLEVNISNIILSNINTSNINTSNITSMVKILLSPISQGDVLFCTQVENNVLSIYAIVPDNYVTNTNTTKISNKCLYRSVEFPFNELYMNVLIRNPCCCQSQLPMNSTTGSTLLCTLPCRTCFFIIDLN